jgi:hypothetical protein
MCVSMHACMGADVALCLFGGGGWMDAIDGWTFCQDPSEGPTNTSSHTQPPRLYQVLPISSGPPPDVDTIIRSLRDNALPPRPPGGPPPHTYGRGERGGASGPGAGGGGGGVGGGASDPRGERRGRKRGRWGGGGDSESDDEGDGRGGGGGAGAGDVFRARQHERLMKG